jgi:purine-nucleoside phosphorylase
VDEHQTVRSGPTNWSDVEAHRLAEHAADALAAITGRSHHDVAVVLGTGLAAAADALGPALSRHPLDNLPGLPTSFVSHQTSEFRLLDLEGRRVLVFLGRLHLYEGYSPAQVVHPVRTAAAAGCSTVILTNASGSLRPELRTGAIALIADHLNLTGRSPLSADPTATGLPTPFVDLVDAWSPRLRRIAHDADPTLTECVYAQVGGPHFETPAEIRMLRTLGADLVGMSSVMEAIAARQVGAEVLGLSLVTNLAAGMEDEGISPGDIIGVGEGRAADVGRLVREIIRTL